MTLLQRLAMFWWTIGAGVLLFLFPLFLVGQVILTVRDHRRHHDWKVTGLAVAWPILCISMTAVLGGNMSPPLFGIPLLLVFSMSWMLASRTFAFGVGSFFVLSALVVIASALSDDGGGHVRWGYLLLWPLALSALLYWRTERLAALEAAA